MMRVPSTWDLLHVWESAASEPAYERAIALLAAASEQPTHEIADLPIGERDARLLRLRAMLFGDAISGVSDCSSCGTRVEVNLYGSELTARPGDPSALVFTHEGQTVSLRQLTTADLRRVAMHPRPERLLDLAVASCEGGDISDSADWLAEVSSRLERADPRANIEFVLRCPACGSSWTSRFDVVSFLWRELDSWVSRCLRNVHDLASAYGWTESEIFSLSPLRMRRYLELIRS
jgi:hypothetical protein